MRELPPRGLLGDAALGDEARTSGCCSCTAPCSGSSPGCIHLLIFGSDERPTGRQDDAGPRGRRHAEPARGAAPALARIARRRGGGRRLDRRRLGAGRLARGQRRASRPVPARARPRRPGRAARLRAPAARVVEPRGSADRDEVTAGRRGRARTAAARRCASGAPSCCGARPTSTTRRTRTRPTRASSTSWRPTRRGSCGCSRSSGPQPVGRRAHRLAAARRRPRSWSRRGST